MRAIVVDEETSKLSIDEVADEAINADEVKVKIKATAVNRADILQRMGLYPPPEGETDILGLEMAGYITEVGSNVKHLKVNDNVFSLLPGGGYAEYVVTDARNIMKMPENITWEEAAAIPEAFLTAYLNLKKVGDLKHGETVLIHAGASGVGTAAIQIAKILGAKVIVTAGSEEKMFACQQLGADYAINYKTEDFTAGVLEAAPEGVDVILDCVGASYWEKNIDVLKQNGRWILIGVLGGTTVENFDMTRILIKNIQLIGSTLRSKTNAFKMELAEEFYQFAADHFQNGQLKPVIDKVFDWSETESAHDYMIENKNIGKIVLRVDDSD